MTGNSEIIHMPDAAVSLGTFRKFSKRFAANENLPLSAPR
jgi:hypothetical protein